jgi:cytochrome c biogenesis protein CcdA
MKFTGVLLLVFLLALPIVAAQTVAPSQFPPGVLKILQYREQLAASITFLIAFIAGIISFTSPCGFVLLPTFFSFLFKERKRAVLMTAFFCAGLILAFTTLGLSAAILGVFINEFKKPFAVVSGFIFIAFGIMTLLNKGFTWFQFKLDHHKAKSAFTMTLFGFFFALGWTPCVGPVLGGILLLAANAGTVLTGTAYLVFYALGVSLPLLLVAMLSDKFDLAHKKWIQGKVITFKLFGKEIVTHTYNIASAIILIFIGVIMIWWQGTTFFEIYVPRLIPWSMDFFYIANDSLTAGGFLSSGLGQFLGFLLGFVILGTLAWIVIRQWQRSREL